MMVWVFAHTIYSQQYEIYAGSAINANDQLGNGYMAGFNFIMDTHQGDREWANRILFGIEHSGFYSGTINISNESSNDVIIKECDECVVTTYNLPNNKKGLLKYTRGVSLNFGVDVYKGLFLTTGVTSYNHYTEINNKVIHNFRTIYIDAGVKYFIKSNRWYFIPTIKYNPEVTSFGLGVSWE